MEVRHGDGTIRAVDEAKTSVDITASDWCPTESGPRLSASVDERRHGRTTELQFPNSVVVVVDQATGRSTSLGSGEGPVEFPDAAYEIRVEAPLKCFVRADGPVTVARPGHRRTDISFPEPTAVTVGFRSRVESPPDSVTVPRTPEGVATALSTLSVAFRTTTADRSFASMRTHPPLVEFGDTFDVPAELEAGRPNTGVSLTLPADLSYLIPAGSLVHYLGADVDVEAGAEPTLHADGVSVALGHGRAYEETVSSVLRRVFWLDCLVRSAGPHGANIEEADLLEELTIDASRLHDASLGRRTAAYLDTSFERIADRLPEWHLSMYVKPTYEHVTVLPHLLQNVPQFFSPTTRPLANQDRLDRSLDDFYRRSGTVPTVELRKADLGPSRYHGWLADEIPLDVFKSLPEAYENRASYLSRAGDPISVVTVLNAREMGEEYEEAARIYRERASQLDIDIDIRESLTTAELARTFETRTDLVHYIGHCEESGLRCADGNLSISSIDESRAQTFFLNACGSYYEGMELVRKGSVAGAVTFQKVLDSQAAKVGVMFARLVVHGYSIERALDLARRRVIMGKDYAVVGDGTHVLSQTESVVGSQVTLERRGDDEWDLEIEMPAPNLGGSRMQVFVTEAERPCLLGAKRSYTLSKADLIAFLEKGSFPVIYDCDIHWSSDIAAKL
jgi:hypothetical protein